MPVAIVDHATGKEVMLIGEGTPFVVGQVVGPVVADTMDRQDNRPADQKTACVLVRVRLSDTPGLQDKQVVLFTKE